MDTKDKKSEIFVAKSTALGAILGVCHTFVHEPKRDADTIKIIVGTAATIGLLSLIAAPALEGRNR